MAIFRSAVASKYTKDHYERFLKTFLDFAGVDADSFVSKAKLDPAWCQQVIIDYYLSLSKRVELGEIKQNSTRNFSKPLHLFCDMNDLTFLNWKKLNRLVPSRETPADDTAPRIEQLRKLCEYPDRRMKLVVASMCSGGFRVGSWDYLNWGDVSPIEKDGTVIAAKIVIYRGEPEQYETFVSGEAYQEILRYMEYRKNQGERINAKSPVLRDLIRGDRGGFGEPHIAKRLDSRGLLSLLSQAIFAQGLRTKLENGERRHAFGLSKGFRKFHETVLGNSGINVIHLGILRGDSNGLRANYSRPSEEDLLNSYMKALPRLTIWSEPPKIVRVSETDSDKKIRELEDYIRMKDKEDLEYRARVEGALRKARLL